MLKKTMAISQINEVDAFQYLHLKQGLGMQNELPMFLNLLDVQKTLVPEGFKTTGKVYN